MTKRKLKETCQPGGKLDISKSNTNSNKRKGIPTINVLENFVKDSVIGQDQAIERIATAIYRSIEFRSLKTNILVIGGSGTGKTEIITQIAKRLKLPYTIEDATKYTKEGYYGCDVEDMIYNLIENANYDIKKAERGLLIIDEIDKKATGNVNDISGSDVLKSMLRLIQGTKIKLHIPEYLFVEEKEIIEFDTSNLIVIFMGAFSGLNDIRDKRLGKGTAGFVKNINDASNLTSRYTKEDLNQYGMPQEFIGRIDTIVETRDLTIKDLEDILRKSRLSVFKKYKKGLKQKGISLSYDGNLITNIAKNAFNCGTGARELSNTVNYIFEDILHEVFKSPIGKYSKCVLYSDIVEDNTKYQLS